MKSNLRQVVPEVPEDSSVLLKMLVDCAKSNAGKKPGGMRYDSTLKEFGTLMFTIGGPADYEILSGNLPLPSVATVRKLLTKTNLLEEGQFRFASLKDFLVQRKLPLAVWISEDGTRVNGRVQYCPRSNQLVGFVPPLDGNGVPVVKSYPATSAEVMSSYFKSNEVSKIAYTVIAQPISDRSPSFCLALFGTNNRFNSSQVVKRWDWMVAQAREYGIQILGFSSDGDCKLLKAMLYKTVEATASKWLWFPFGLDASVFFVQDTIHAATKLKTRLLKASRILPMGKNHVASRGHIAELIKTVPKELHGLSQFLLNDKDKMNFKTVLKLCDTRVTDQLREKVPGSEATATYLEMIRGIMDPYLGATLSPLDRVGRMYEWVFFLRLWRRYISTTEGYTVGNNFITSNAYSCIEVNANALVAMIHYLRISGQPSLFLPHLFSSQPCEEFYRAARSMTSTHSTVVNFSILELEQRVRRIDFVKDSFIDLEGSIRFPRLEKSGRKATQRSVIADTLPEDDEIEEEVVAAFKRAVERATKFGLVSSNVGIPRSFLQVTPLPNEAESSQSSGSGIQGDEPNCESNLESDSESDEETPASRNSLTTSTEDFEDLEEDLIVVSTGSLGLRSPSNVQLTEKSPFVQVTDSSGQPAIVRKSSLCWLLSSGDTRLSSDRLQRVKGDQDSQSRAPPCAPAIPGKARQRPSPQKEEYIDIGDWCAFTAEDGSIAVGRVLAFSYLTGTTPKSLEYSALSAPTKPPTSKARGVGCLCSWFKLSSQSKLSPTNMDIHGFYDVRHYICHLPRPTVDSARKCLILSCSVREIETVT